MPRLAEGVRKIRYSGYARYRHVPPVKGFAVPLLRGSGQMLFQPSAFTGAVFLLLVASQSLHSLALCMAGLAGATLCAYVIERPGPAYLEGLGGFNGGLLGLALSAFYDFDAALLLLALAGGGMTGLLRVALLRILPAPPFTTPFVLVAWSIMASASVLGLAPLAATGTESGIGRALGASASQVLFIDDPWIGVLVCAAVWLHSRTAGMWVAGAVLAAWPATVLLTLPATQAAAGLFGYNGVILAAALQHRRTPLLLALAGVVATVGVARVFMAFGVTPLSAPFVLCAWLVIGLEKYWPGRR